MRLANSLSRRMGRPTSQNPSALTARIETPPPAPRAAAPPDLGLRALLEAVSGSEISSAPSMRPCDLHRHVGDQIPFSRTTVVSSLARKRARSFAPMSGWCRAAGGGAGPRRS